MLYSGSMMGFVLRNWGIRRDRGMLLRYGGTAGLFGVFLAVLAACSSPGSMLQSAESNTKEYFSESEYGVKASPRVSYRKSRLKRGGGRYQVGKPYKIKGKWYRPKEDKNYDRVGKASWYGEAFHGRLTANGEVYDMTHLTAAHPTMPLPSYARVTNLKNGRSVVVRVNDRGPYAHGRIIDLSKRAAQLLDYTKSGTAKVRVQYVGRAPLDGRDDRYLVASYRGPVHQGTRPTGKSSNSVLVAMNGLTRKRSSKSAKRQRLVQPVPAETAPDLPKFGPIIPDRPTAPLLSQSVFAPKTGRLLSYADTRIKSAASPFSKILAEPLNEADLKRFLENGRNAN